ncbi:unnamed protein product [Rhizoctonia solani]|uniref:Uncharacterized protein n=1 Tax=Rhizoctonia solani TaxID=456999 RepID=A0A8H3E530_9AGAM|nr:unnamed protein product [Rhizoctonia solani]CAE7175766.1 unnamed protein product [Rhizoctonia solani]
MPPLSTIRFQICLCPVATEKSIPIDVRIEVLELEETEVYLTNLDDIAQAMVVRHPEFAALTANTVFMFSDSQGRHRIFLRKDLKGWSFPESGPVVLDSLELRLYIIDMGVIIDNRRKYTTLWEQHMQATQ